MAGNLCERRLHGWIHRRRRGLPRHNRSSAVVRRLYIHEAPRCCDQATLQWKSVRDCGAIQKNAKRCKNRTKFRKLAAQTTRPTATDLGRRARRDLIVGERTQSTGNASGMFTSQHQATGAKHLESVLAIVCVIERMETHRRGPSSSGFSAPSPGAIQEEPGTPVTIQVWNGPSGPPTPRPPRNKGRSAHARSLGSRTDITPPVPLAVGPSASAPGTPRENFCGFIDP